VLVAGNGKLRGKFGQQFLCVEGVGPFLVQFNQFAGAPETVAGWDEPKPISHELRQTKGTLFRWLPNSAALRGWRGDVAIGSSDCSLQVVAGSQVSETPGWPLIVVYWDVSPLAVGVSIRRKLGSVWKTGDMFYKGGTTIATFGAHLEHQVHQESAGGLPLAMQILRSLADICSYRVLFVNDCLPVVLAIMRRKRSNSPQLQSDAEYTGMALASLESGCKSLYLHIPGTEMIA
jgi:hypothetical protein